MAKFRWPKVRRERLLVSKAKSFLRPKEGKHIEVMNAATFSRLILKVVIGRALAEAHCNDLALIEIGKARRRLNSPDRASNATTPKRMRSAFSIFLNDRADRGASLIRVICSWCPRSESNRHTLRYAILSRARLPVPPLRALRIPIARLLAFANNYWRDFGCPPLRPSSRLWRSPCAAAADVRPLLSRFLLRLFLHDVDCRCIDHILDVRCVELLDHFDAGTAVLGDLIDVGSFHEPQQI